ncbi:30S ribosomal protein S9 [Conexibacter sp. SYSU D00693]|uniref:30S ribosomal protein S9 n=1 Tax=Conexibacter sp. SYSU D00693 TaxID=2812560 RepID=UPI00196B086B
MSDETPQPDEQQEALEAAAANEVPQPDADATPEAPAADEAPATEDAPVAEVPAAEGEPITPSAAGIEHEDEADTEDDEEPAAPRVKPAIPGADLEVDIVLDETTERDPYALDDDDEPVAEGDEDEDEVADEPIAAVSIDLAADARYRATGKRKSGVARVTLKPGTGAYTVNGKDLNDYFPRETLQRTIRQPLETVGYEDRLDVVARIHGGGVAAQAGALRHGISRALLEADPNLRLELKRRGFLTRDARVKERKKAGLKKARKRPQFSKR